MSKPNFKCNECGHEFYCHVYDMVDDSCSKCGKGAVMLIEVINKRILMEKEYLRTMMPAFDATIIEEHPHFIRFSLPTYSKATRFVNFLGSKGFRKSGLTMELGKTWTIVVWF